MQMKLQNDLQAALVQALGLPGPLKLQLRKCEGYFDFSFHGHFCKGDHQWAIVQNVLNKWPNIVAFERNDKDYINIKLSTGSHLSALKDRLASFAKPRDNYSYIRVSSLCLQLHREGLKPQVPHSEGIINICLALNQLKSVEEIDDSIQKQIAGLAFRRLPEGELAQWLWLFEAYTALEVDVQWSK